MGASCGCMSKKASREGESPSKNSNIITNKGGVLIGSAKAPAGDKDASSGLVKISNL